MVNFFSRELREALAYAIGAVGFLHELFLAHAERPFLLTASLALMGFPLVFKGDEKLKEKLNQSEGEKKEEQK